MPLRSLKPRLTNGALTILFVLSCAFLLTSCSALLTGLVYTQVRLPLTWDLNHTPLPEGEPGSKQIVEIKEPVTGYGFYARVNSNAVGDIAKEAGFKKVYFADQEIFSILGIWTGTRVIVYGEK